jgi:hypothetical protein
VFQKALVVSTLVASLRGMMSDHTVTWVAPIGMFILGSIVTALLTLGMGAGVIFMVLLPATL